ncbi:MAG TPA: hypothetical protein VFP84_24755 [Kofleriaceae bacterium]|nr:hypothetical protein [Kofleriaceae bacterium]
MPDPEAPTHHEVPPDGEPALAPITHAPIARAALRGWLFRVGFVYWIVYAGTLVLSSFDLPVLRLGNDALSWLLRTLDLWVGHHVLGLTEIAVDPTGSGDRMIDWIELAITLGLALVIGSVWAGLDRRRAHDARLRAVLRVVVRYGLGFSLLYYGVSKIVGFQFQPPSDGQLLKTWGESSPMNVLWTFIGASPAYQMFGGIAETLGGALVLFRRTTLLGALVVAGVMLNVVLLNFCYDVPVKLGSSHLLAMSIVLILPDARRLLDLLVRGRGVAPPAAPLPPVLAGRRWRIARAVVKLAVIANMLIVIGRGLRRGDDAGPPPWLAGAWLVSSFTRDGHEAVASDAARWDRLTVQAYNGELYARVRLARANGPAYGVKVDDAAHTLAFTDKAAPNAAPVTWRAARDPGDPTHLALSGAIDGHPVEIKLERFDADKLLLRSRGFHWISEAPFNR